MLTISGIRGKFSGVKASRDVGLSVIAGASRRVSGVRNSMRLPGHDVIRSIAMRSWSPAAVSSMVMAYGCGRARRETAKIEIRKTNLECPLQSTKPKNEVGKGALKPAFRSSRAGHKSFIRQQISPAKTDFAATRLLVSDCRQEAYLSIPAYHQQSVNASSSTACGGGVRPPKIKIRKTNLECPLESTKPKNELGKETVTPAFRSPGSGTKSFIHNRLTVRRRDFTSMGSRVASC